MKKFKVMAAATIFALSGSALAVEEYSYSDDGMKVLQVSGSKYIVRIATRANGIHSIYTDTPLDNLDGCTLSDRGVFDETSVGGKSMLATVLSASLSGLQVKFDVDGCLDIGGSTAKTASLIKNIKIFIPVPI